MKTLQLQIQLNKECEFEIIDTVKKLDDKTKSILNAVINARENLDNDFYPDLIVHRTKKFQNRYVEIISKDFIDVETSIKNEIQKEKDEDEQLLLFEMTAVNNIIKAELALLA